MKVLLTGATSGLGLNAAGWLLDAGHQLHATGRNLEVGNTLRGLGAAFTALDLSQASAQECERLMQGCEAVWHCAAKSSPWGTKADFYLANEYATKQLASAAARCGVPRFVHISTPAIYFDFQHHYQIAESYRASRFANLYASSKYLAEQQVVELVPRYPDTIFVILRPRGLFGPHDRVILPRVLEQIRGDRGILRLPRAGQATLDLTFVLNAVHAMDLATRAHAVPSGAIYNITNHQPLRLVDMLNSLMREQLGLRYQVRNAPYQMIHTLAASLELIARVTGKEPALTRYAVAAANFDMTLSTTKAKAELGYRPLYSIEEGIHRTGQWLQANTEAVGG